jgi:hypothetical protein
MHKFTKLTMMLTMAASLSMAGAASAHGHQPLSWTHRDYGHGDWYGHDHGHGHGDDHHHGGCGCGGGLFSLFTRRVVVHHYYPPPPPVYCAPSLYPRPTAGREEPREVVMEEEVWDGKDKKHSAHRRRPTSGSGGAGSTD